MTSASTLHLASIASDVIVNGLNEKTFERVGGAVLVAGTKKIIALIRGEDSARSVLSIAAGAMGSAGEIGKPVIEGIGSTALGLGSGPIGVLSLGITQMQFAVLLKRVTRIEQRLQETQAVLEQVNRKLDLGFYSNFYAALDLASRAFTMEKAKNRKDATWQAVNRLAEARRHYTRLADFEISAGSKLAKEYLSTLLLAYAAEIRCYLEMDEPHEAMKLLDQGIADLHPRVQYHINTLLTSNRAIFLHPSLKGEIDICRLTRVLQWFNSELTETAVFEQQRENLFNLRKDFGESVRALPTAIWDPLIDGAAPAGGMAKATGKLTSTLGKWLAWDGTDKDAQIFRHLADTFSTIETMIEDISRFQAYKAEIQVIQELGIGFSKWKRPLASEREAAEDRNLFLITSLEPLNLTLMPVNEAPVAH